MGFSFSSLSEIYTQDFDTVIDVRAPSEFAEDHLPDAINLPVLSDEERAEVGQIYVQDSPFKARKIGAALVAANAAEHLRGPLADQGGSWRPLIYCWRGGQRSGSFASILSQIGWRTTVLKGGYKSYRRLIVERLYDVPVRHRLYLLDGLTGTAKTAILNRFSRLGGQSLDLEALARHRGSLLGGYAGGQPSQKAFEGALGLALSRLDTERPVLVEAESSKIGERVLPPMLWAAMRDAPRIRIEAPLAARADYLVRTYADLASDTVRLTGLLKRLSPYLAKAKQQELVALAERGAHVELARSLINEHYDPRYRRAAKPASFTIKLDGLSEPKIAAAAEEILARLA